MGPAVGEEPEAKLADGLPGACFAGRAPVCRFVQGEGLLWRQTFKDKPDGCQAAPRVGIGLLRPALLPKPGQAKLQMEVCKTRLSFSFFSPF